MLDTVFESKDIALLRSISKVANACNCHIYLVGGIVRDILLGKKPKDIDIAVVGDVLSLIGPLKEKLLCKVIKVQQELKTVTIEFRKDLVIDFTTTRKEIYGARKGIPIAGHFGCPIKDDVLRRDFTINAMAISLNSIDYEHVLDFVGGKEDLANKKLRVLHDNSFNDDPTRIIRGFKFAKRLGFTLEDRTRALQEEYLNSVDYSEVVSPIRVKKEMFEVFAMDSIEVIQDFINQKIYKVLSDKINQIDFVKVKELINQYNITEDIPFIYFTCLFFNKYNYGILKQFNLTRQEIKVIQDLKFAEELDGKLSDLEIHQQYSSRSKTSLLLEYLLRNNNNLKKYFENLNDVKIEVTSQDLLMMGVPESRDFSIIFNKLLEAKIKGELPDKISELRFVRRLLMNNEV